MFICPANSSLTQGKVIVMLDGFPVGLPSVRRSLTAILSHLETMALERQRILVILKVDGELVNPAELTTQTGTFSRVEAETINLDELPLQLLKTAAEQTATARAEVDSAVALVLINDSQPSQELWWKLARRLKDPLLTLSLLPDNSCASASGAASLSQLRKWQLQQLATIIKDVDDSCATNDMTLLSDVLEIRVLKWLDQLQQTISLWHDTVSAGLQKPVVAS